MAAVVLSVVCYIAPSGANTPGTWNAYYYTNGALGGPIAVGTADSASVPFSNGYVSNMTNSSYSGSLLGDTVSATVALNGVTANVPVTSYAGGQCAASVRFFFVSKAQSTVTSPSPGSLGQTEQLLLASNGSPSNPSFGLAPSAYYTQTWWSHSVSWALVSGASANLSELISTADWSDWNGQSAASLPTQFANAASHVQSFGLSFGGCGFYENGAGTSDGSGVFSMSNFSIG